MPRLDAYCNTELLALASLDSLRCSEQSESGRNRSRQVAAVWRLPGTWMCLIPEVRLSNTFCKAKTARFTIAMIAPSWRTERLRSGQ